MCKQHDLNCPVCANDNNPVLSVFNHVFGWPAKLQGMVSNYFLNTIDRMQTQQAIKDMHDAIEKERRQPRETERQE